MNTITFKQQLGLRYEPSRFISKRLAEMWSANTTKPSLIILGCDSRFWVVCPADGSKLNKIGYEYA